MSRIVLEVATFADAVKKAEMVAPTRGSAFDKAAGIVMEFDPAGVPMATLRATNLDVFRIEWINTVEMSGDAPVQWRFPRLFGTIVAGLPIGSGKDLILEERGGQVHLTAGRTKAKFNLLNSYDYPAWDPFDPDNMYTVKDLGGRIGMVEWACSRDVVPLTGVLLDGEYAIATDRYRLCAVPLEIPELTEPIVVPSGFLSQMLKQTGEVQIGVANGMLQIMPDEYTQIKTVTYGETFPPYGGFFAKTFDEAVELKKGPLLDIMKRAEAFAGTSDRVGAAIKVFFGKEKIAVVMNNEEVGQLGDVIDVPGFAAHDRIEVKFGARYIIEALDKAPNDQISVHYDRSANRVIHVDGGSRYSAWIAVRTDTSSGSE